MGVSGEECYRQKGKPMQRPWGRTLPGDSEQQQGPSVGGPVWLEWSRGKRGRGNEGRGETAHCGPQ